MLARYRLESSADLRLQVGGISEQKLRSDLALLVRPAYSHCAAGVRESTGLSLNSVTPNFYCKFFQCNDYIFRRSLKSANFLVSESS